MTDHNHYPPPTIDLPRGFRFGAATASYQIEGAVAEDGRGTSIWDTFCRRPGAIRNGDTGDKTCDHYHRYPEDIALMRDIGLDAYRMSVAWPRVVPDGVGTVNDRGLDFYDRVVDNLLSAGIEPFVTLYHWDLPHALQDRGGWANRDIAHWFGDYVDHVVHRLGDRVSHWITLNEPKVFTMLGHLLGMHAPGARNPWRYFRAVHHALLAHGEAVQRIRARASDARVGITLDLSPVYPETETPRDRRAAAIADEALNRFFLDPVLRGRYPDFARRVRLFMPRVRPDDMTQIRQPLDFLGLNNYTRTYVRAAPVPGFGFWSSAIEIAEHEAVRNGVQYTSMGWEVYPDGIYQLLTRIRDEYGNIPVYVTENGAAYSDHPTLDGSVHDPLRVEYLAAYLGAVARAVDEGCDCRGYFVWTLMDNFEWAEGFDKRFGLVYVDFATGARTPKTSARWYRDLIAAARDAADAADP